MSNTGKIGSFAVLDLETTGFPGYNFNKANITELAIHGFCSEAVRKAASSDIPRVNHKLSLNFNPQMMIQPRAEEITGLDNFMLENESSLDENAARIIVSFLKHLRQPVCLVAHNGNKFDFPLIKKALEKHKCDLPSDLVCIDTLEAIKELDRLAQEQEDDVICFSQEEKISIPLHDIVDGPSETIAKTDIENEKPSDWQKLNETTPKRPPGALGAKRNHGHLIRDNDETSPTESKIKSRRSLFKSPNQCGNIKQTNMFGQYKLGTIYTRLFGEAPQTAHQAEADVLLLKKVMFHYGKSFVEYSEANAKPFAEVKKVGAS